MKELDSIILTRDVPELGLTKGWPGCLLLTPRADRKTVVVEFFWGDDWLDSDVFDVPKDAVRLRGTHLRDEPKRTEPVPW